jgi:DNA-binding MarR family transcriptional regulator
LFAIHPDDEHPPLGYMVVRIAEAVDREFVAVLADLGLKPRHVRLLVLVDRTPGLNQRELARQLEMDAGNLIALLDPLEEGGLLKRTRDRANRRQRLVALTPKGRRILDKARRATAEVDARIIAGLSPTQQRTYYETTLAIYRGQSALEEHNGRLDQHLREIQKGQR